MSEMQLWAYREQAWSVIDMTGFDVEAVDGSIGKVDEASEEVDSAYIVVDTGPWIFGKKVMIPAGVIDHVDVDEQNVYVNRTKSEIKGSPEFDPEKYREPSYRHELGGYYGRLSVPEDEEL